MIQYVPQIQFWNEQQSCCWSTTAGIPNDANWAQSKVVVVPLAMGNEGFYGEWMHDDDEALLIKRHPPILQWS